MNSAPILAANFGGGGPIDFATARRTTDGDAQSWQPADRGGQARLPLGHPAAADLLGRPVVLRELMPQDLKLEIDQFSRAEAVTAARYLAYVVGRAHARQLDEADRDAWRRDMERHHPGDLDAPNWLWSSVVALAGRHEQGYLEHCRAYALAAAA